MTNDINGKTTPDAVAILGIPFDRVRLQQAVQRIEEMIAIRKPHFLVTANVDFLVQARSDIELRRILISADMVLCDGTPIVWASRLLRNPLPERVAGSDLVPFLIKRAAEKGYRIFLLGGSPESAQAASERVREEYPRINLECYSPPFKKLLEMDHQEIRRRILEARPDLLFVSFGCPKQEKWIAMHYRELGVPVCVGVGATVDFLAQQVKRAPEWVQRSGGEWLYRLAQEPRRLAGRYSRDLWVFGRSFLEQYFSERLPRRKTLPAGSTDLVMEGSWRLEKLPSSFTALTLASERILTLPVTGSHWVIDAGNVQVMDGAGVARLVRWNEFVRKNGGSVLLFNPSRAVGRALDFARARELFDVASDLSAARSWMEAQGTNEPRCVRHQSTSEGFKVIWQGEITAANAETVWSATSFILNDRLDAMVQPREVVVDLSEVSFLDSTGLGVLVRLRKAAGKAGLKFRCEGLQPAVQNVVRLAQLETLLLGNLPGRRHLRWAVSRGAPRRDATVA